MALRLNLNLSFKSQLMVIKAVEVTSTELNMCYTNTKYIGSRGRMVSVLSLWLKRPGFKPHWALFYFSKNKLTEKSLKCAWHSVDGMVTEWWLKCGWNPPLPSPFSPHSATIQSPFSRLKGGISSCERW